MTKAKNTPAGFLAFTLHAHLPYVVNHGTWPHGIEWLHEAAAETYLPLCCACSRNLERDGVPANFNINLSPILLEQLAHPLFIAEFPKYLTRKIVAAREDEAYFIQSGDLHLTETARFWGRFFSAALDDFNALGGNIIQGFRHFNDTGMIEILTCGATHGYMPLLGTDESVRAQVRTAVCHPHPPSRQAPPRHLGAGVRLPARRLLELPRPEWPTAEQHPGFDRIGIEQALSESNLDYFFVDTHLVEESRRIPSPYGPAPRAACPRDPQLERATQTPQRSLYQPYYVDGPYDKRFAITVFPRDPSTGLQVWSGETGYPGDANYLDFHKKRFPGGHRYWQVTGPAVDIGDKLVYWPQQAAERVKEHASHFVSLVYETLEPGFNNCIPPVLCAPFDAELFGHWWFEGPMWLEAVCRILHEQPTGIATITCSQYLDRYPRAGLHRHARRLLGRRGQPPGVDEPGDLLDLHPHLPRRTLRARSLHRGRVAQTPNWAHASCSSSAANSCCSNPPTGSSSSPPAPPATTPRCASSPTTTSSSNSKPSGRHSSTTDRLNEHMPSRLAEIEHRDSIFPDIDPSLWASGAHASRGSDTAEGEKNVEVAPSDSVVSSETASLRDR